MVMVLYPGNGHKAEFGELEGQPVPGSAEGEIGLRRWLEDEGHELITTTDREGGGRAGPEPSRRCRPHHDPLLARVRDSRDDRERLQPQTYPHRRGR